MSRALEQNEQAPTPTRSRPAYGDGPLVHEAPSAPPESLDRRHQLALGLAIFGPALAAYVAAGYVLYKTASEVL